MERYFSYFDPKFLFIQASDNTTRHTTPGVGILHPIEAPLVLLGLLFLFVVVSKKKRFIPLVLIAAAPVAASMVVEARSSTRAVVIVYGFALLIALGIYVIYKQKYGKIMLSILAVLYILSFSYIAHQYLVHKLYHHPWHSDVGLKEMVEVVNEKQDMYKNVVMSNGHYIPYLFYNKVHPEVFVDNSVFYETAQTNGVRLKRFGKIFFNMPYECPLAGKEEVLYVCFGYKVPLKANLVEVIRFKDGQPAILIVDFGKKKEDEQISLPQRVERGNDVDQRFKNGVIPDDYELFWPENI
jgi:hypothetical protein